MDETVTVCTGDGQEYCVLVKEIRLSKTVNNLLEDGSFGTIPLPNIQGAVFEKVMQYAKAALVHPIPEGRELSSMDLYDWERAFVDSLPDDDHMRMLYDLLLASNYLDMVSLLDLCTRYIAIVISSGLKAKEIRERFAITEDFEPGEEDTIRKQNVWEMGGMPLITK